MLFGVFVFLGREMKDAVASGAPLPPPPQSALADDRVPCPYWYLGSIIHYNSCFTT